MTSNAFESTDAVPDAAVNFNPVVAVSIWMPLNVAMPDAFVVALPPAASEPEVGVRVTGAFGTRLFDASRAVTVTAGVIVSPAATFEGCVPYTKLLTAPPVITTSLAGEAAELVLLVSTEKEVFA